MQTSHQDHQNLWPTGVNEAGQRMKTFKKEGETAQTFLVRYNILNRLIYLSTLFILPRKQVPDLKKEKRQTRGKILSDKSMLVAREDTLSSLSFGC